jgi:glycogen debranching enzyme
MPFSKEILQAFWQGALTTLEELRSPLGVMASGQDGLFHALFGRDALWTVLLALEAGRHLPAGDEATMQSPRVEETIAYRNWLFGLSASVLRGLAGLQGRVVNDRNEEQPGRIVHEYWNPVPPQMVQARWPVSDGNGRYYGAFDVTFLYIITMAHVEAYFDDRTLLDELWPHIHAAFQWMLDWSDLDRDGLVEYKLRNPDGIGLENQVWKDSGESIRARTGDILTHPLAWIEVQGYALQAYTCYQQLAEKSNHLDEEARQEIQRRIEGLRQGLQRFWLPGAKFPVIALDGRKKPLDVASSNPGHLLWSGVLDSVRAQQICERLLQADLFTPWGIRTLSDQAYYYDPFKYQCGTVWPFDNTVIAIGMQHYGFDESARQVAASILHALAAIENPVELYMVLPARLIRSPRLTQQWALVDYIYASTTQAWTAAALLYLVSLFL